MDGKAAQSMAKMKLFKDFYVMVITYVYFTRIIEKLLRFVLPYEHSWLCDASGELATLAFYVLTGMKVFPAEHNPYFSIPDDIGREDPF